MENQEKVILTNMCMIFDGSKLLVQEKVGKGFKGITCLGGHVESAEPIVDSVIREIKEETGFTIKSPKLCGIKDWFEEDGSRYMVFIFRTDDFEGSLKSSEEGRVFGLNFLSLKIFRQCGTLTRWLGLHAARSIQKFFLIPQIIGNLF